MAHPNQAAVMVMGKPARHLWVQGMGSHNKRLGQVPVLETATASALANAPAARADLVQAMKMVQALEMVPVQVAQTTVRVLVEVQGAAAQVDQVEARDRVAVVRKI